MIKLLLNTIFIGFLEPFILDSESHLEIFKYYFGSEYLLDKYNLVYFALMLAILLFFLPSFLKMLTETSYFVRDLFRYKIKIKTSFNNYRMFNMFVAVLSLSIFSLVFKLVFKPISLDLKYVCLILILSGILLKSLSVFRGIRLNSYTFKLSDILILSFLNLLGFIPGVSHTFIVIFIGIMIGLEFNLLVHLSFLSLVPYLFIAKLDFAFPSISGFYGYLEFFLMVFLLLLVLKLVYNLLVKKKFYRFYLYLLGLGLWTIIDIMCSK